MAIVEKHPLWLRVTHWIGFPALALMVWSGVLIYWANDVYPGFFPEWFYAAFSIDHRLAEGMAVHFTVGWIFVLNGLAYLALSLASGHWRELVPVARPGRFKLAQKAAYSGFIALALLEGLSGFAIYKPVQLRWLVSALGGYESARLIHFACMVLIVVFFAAHVIQVARAGWNTLHAMIAGGTRRSLIALALSAAAACGAWMLASGSPKRDEAPGAFRRVLEWNGSIWAAGYSPKRLSSFPAPRPGEEFRLNGEIGLESAIDPASWTMEARNGPADRGPPGMRLGMAALRAMPRADASAEFYCIEGWSQGLAYSGIRFSDFLSFTGLGTRSGKPWNPGDAGSRADLYKYVGLRTPDGAYYVSIDMESMLHPQTLLAYEMNGAPLAPEHGAPLRLVIPVKYGIKSLKRVGVIFFSDERPPDYWAERGYDWYSGL